MQSMLQNSLYEDVIMDYMTCYSSTVDEIKISFEDILGFCWDIKPWTDEDGDVFPYTIKVFTKQGEFYCGHYLGSKADYNDLAIYMKNFADYILKG
jgi:hypothetical protein